MDRFEVQNLRRHEGGKHLCLFAGRRKSDEKEGMGRQGKEGRRLEGGDYATHGWTVFSVVPVLNVNTVHGSTALSKN